MCSTWHAENTGRKKVAKNRHLGTIAQLCRAISSQLRHVSTIEKIVKQQYLLHMSLVAEIVSLDWGTPANFNRFRFLAALLHGTLVVAISQTMRRWTEGATYIRQGSHHVGHWPTFLVRSVFVEKLWITFKYWNVHSKPKTLYQSNLLALNGTLNLLSTLLLTRRVFAEDYNVVFCFVQVVNSHSRMFWVTRQLTIAK